MATALGGDRTEWAAAALRRQGVPPGEIRAILGAEDPRTVHRYLELHRERLREELDVRLRAIARLERLLIVAAVDAGGVARVVAS